MGFVSWIRDPDFRSTPQRAAWAFMPGIALLLIYNVYLLQYMGGFTVHSFVFGAAGALCLALSLCAVSSVRAAATIAGVVGVVLGVREMAVWVPAFEFPVTAGDSDRGITMYFMASIGVVTVALSVVTIVLASVPARQKAYWDGNRWIASY